MEVVVLARPNNALDTLMYLPEETMRELMPCGGLLDLRMMQFLLPVQHDCPEQWLRDRLLRLADLVEVAYSEATAEQPGEQEVREALERAGLRLGDFGDGRSDPALPADTGNRVSQEEL